MYRYFKPGRRIDLLDWDEVLYQLMEMSDYGRIIQARKSIILTKPTWVFKTFSWSGPKENDSNFGFLKEEELNLMLKQEVLEELNETEILLMEL
jgi:hypothetical protein